MLTGNVGILISPQQGVPIYNILTSNRRGIQKYMVFNWRLCENFYYVSTSCLNFIPHQVSFSDVHWIKDVTWKQNMSRIYPLRRMAFISKFNGINSLHSE